MALRLEILKVNTYASETAEKETEATFAMTTDTTTYECFLKGKNNKVNRYVISFLNIGFQKKMYQPSEVNIALQFMPYQTEDGSEDWVSIKKSIIEDLFTNKQVKLFDQDGVTKNSDGTEEVPDENYIGEDFYVYKVVPCYYSDSMIVKLTICSPDKQMTIEQNCRAFVSKKLNSEIFTPEVATFKLPYDSGTALAAKSNLQVLAYTKDSKDREHIFPYLVQYNESIYDMLARTANRWGEFLFYEDKALHLGYTPLESDKTATTVKNFSKYTYINLEDTASIGSSYDHAANYDKNISDSPLKKSPNSVSGYMLSPGNKADVLAMKIVASFLKNDKNLPTFITNEAIDGTVASIKKIIEVWHDNRVFNKEYFPSGYANGENAEKYGDYAFDPDKPDKTKTAYNPFSEINSKYTNAKYSSILESEKKAAIDAVCIDFDVTYPKLKLGQIISLSDDSNEYIVVQIDCGAQNMLKLRDDMWIDQSNDKPTPTFQVIAIAKQDDMFYPTVLPTGHVRYAEPQMAVVADEEDPADDAGRVRVVFPWQMGTKKKVDDDLVKVSTPWLQYSANASGQKGIMGKHYKDDKVFVGYLEGNVERPYVIGGLSKGAKTDVECTTPGGHTFKLEDDYGLASSLIGTISPLTQTVGSFIPGIDDLKEKIDFKFAKRLGGGFQLTDRYGIYKISGSTDERSINIASPWGEVKMNAFTGITISAPNGDISIKGKNISIEAGNNLELVSGKNVKHKILGGDVSGFFTDMGKVVERKLVQTGLSIVDLSIIRTLFEIVFRPAEGKLLVKSNRYLMLESGKGECLYPENAYKDKDTYKKYILDESSKDVRKGLKLTSGVKEMVEKINTVGNKIDNDYRTAYNTCVDKCNAFKALIIKPEKLEWCDNYKVGQELKVCKKYDDLKTVLWKEGTDLLKEDDLGFEKAISNKKDDVNGEVVTRYKTKNAGLSDDQAKDKIVADRNTFRTEILEAANALRQAIIDFTAITMLGDDYISGAIGAYQQKVTDELKKSIITAFNKNKLGDSFFVQKIEDDAKKLENAYANNDALIDQRKKLKRKAATTMLEEMGFKDDWRGKYIIPGNPPQSENVPRKFDEKDLNDDYWTKYVATIQNVPDLSAAELTALQKILKDVIDQLLEKKKEVMFWKWNSENSSWGDAKNGEILFSSDANVYHFEKQNITEVPSKFRERLNGADGVTEDATVSTFLTDLRDKLNGLN